MGAALGVKTFPNHGRSPCCSEKAEFQPPPVDEVACHPADSSTRTGDGVDRNLVQPAPKFLI
jgi:hypothetical protein